MEDQDLQPMTAKKIAEDSFTQTSCANFAKEVVNQLQDMLEAVVSERLQLVDVTLQGRLESICKEILSKQDAAFQRFVDVISQKTYASSEHSGSTQRRVHDPDHLRQCITRCVSLPDRTVKESHSFILNKARCKSQKATAQRLHTFHTDRLIRRDTCTPPEKSHSDCLMVSQHAKDTAASPNRTLQERAETNEGATTGDAELMLNKEQENDEEKRKEEKDKESGAQEEFACEESAAALPGSLCHETSFVSPIPTSIPVRSRSMRDLRAQTEASIVAANLQKYVRHGTQDGADDTHTGSQRITEHLRRIWALCGIIPWSSHLVSLWYRRIIVFITGCAMVASTFDFVLRPGQIFENIANLALYTSAFFNLIFMRHIGNLVGPYEDQFTDYAKSHGFLQEWATGGMLRLLFTTTIWGAATSVMCVLSALQAGGYFSLILIGWRNGLFLASIHCLWQILAFLELMLDNYCIEFFERLDCGWGISSWNGLQALFRRVAETVENSFLVVQTAVMIVVFCCAARLVTASLNSGNQNEVLDDPGALIRVYAPILLIALVTVVLFAKAAAVTEKCSGVPPLINSVSLEEDKHMDYERQYLVSYIMQSDAGFYVKGTKLTATLLVKSCYLLGTVLCGVGTTFLSSQNRD